MLEQSLSDPTARLLSEKRDNLVKLYHTAAEEYDQRAKDYHDALKASQSLSLENYDENGMRTIVKSEIVEIESKETIGWHQGTDTHSFRGPQKRYEYWPIFLRLEFEKYSVDSDDIICRAIDGWPTGPKRGVYKANATYKAGYHFGGAGTFEWHTWGGVGNVTKESWGKHVNHKAIHNLVKTVAKKEGVEPGHIKVKELISYKHRGDQDLGLQYEVAKIEKSEPIYEERNITEQRSFAKDSELAAQELLKKHKLMKQASKQLDNVKSQLVNIDSEIEDAGFVYNGEFDAEILPSEIINPVDLAGESFEAESALD